MDEATVLRLSGPAPRYTSYPTAPHFKSAIGPATARNWLAELPDRARMSLYLHIPFCTELCWYCACTTKASRRYEPVAAYVDTLLKEIETVGRLLPKGAVAGHIHWGGGSPSMLKPADIHRILDTLRTHVTVAPDGEHAMEIDPRQATGALLDALVAEGFNRISLGVQDFDPRVQAAIGRPQSLADTQAVVSAFRAHGIASINIDLIYGLPLQTLESVDDTVGKVIELAPDRVAIFGYAHLPQRLKHQRMIPTGLLPDAVARFAQAEHMARRLEAAGYVRIGLDHYARPGDPLARGTVNRNFQGYTSDSAETLIGLGASAIGQLPQGFVQNAVSPADYARQVAATGLATARGFELGNEDRARGWVIKELMCSLRFSTSALRARFPDEAAPLIRTAHDLLRNNQDALIEPTGDGFIVPERGRPFLRSVCARFDAYIGAMPQVRHSVGV